MAPPHCLLLADLVAGNHLHHVPSEYIRPEHDRPHLKRVVSCDAASIPIIDLAGVNSASGRAAVVRAVGSACVTDGFFQIKNHGIPKAVVDAMLRVGREFFRLPESERRQSYCEDPMKTTRLSTSFNVNTEKFGSWRDFLRLDCHPLEQFVQDWPMNPPSFRDVVGEYCQHARQLALILLGVISESLGLDRDCLEKTLGKQAQHMAINYYPPCPDPDLTFGLPGHKDPNAITILLQDDVPGLQVLKNGSWVAVNPIPGTLIINIGDQIQALSNDKYKSILHRAVVNCDRERFSIPTFYCPSMDAVIEPPGALTDDANPRVYSSYTYLDYYQKFWDRGLRKESCLDMFRNSVRSSN